MKRGCSGVKRGGAPQRAPKKTSSRRRFYNPAQVLKGANYYRIEGRGQEYFGTRKVSVNKPLQPHSAWIPKIPLATAMLSSPTVSMHEE